MDRFSPVILDFGRKRLLNTEKLSKLFFLYLRYAKYLDDDFANDNRPLYRYFIENVERLSPFFWVINNEQTNDIAGFVYLDNFTGNSEILHAAEVSACFFKKYWGDFTADTGKKFLKICFEELGLKKVKALIYPQNFRVKTLLKKIGFEKEGLLKAETLRNNKLQDIEIYSVINER